MYFHNAWGSQKGSRAFKKRHLLMLYLHVLCHVLCRSDSSAFHWQSSQGMMCVNALIPRVIQDGIRVRCKSVMTCNSSGLIAEEFV
jgi:hypothetical protein